MVEFSCEVVWSCLLFAGRFLITVSISMFVMGLLKFSISSWFSFGKLYFIRFCPFLPSCPFYWHIVSDSSLLWSFVFLCCLFHIVPEVPEVVLISFSSFFLSASLISTIVSSTSLILSSASIIPLLIPPQCFWSLLLHYSLLIYFFISSMSL